MNILQTLSGGNGRYVGLDVGSSTVKAVELALQDGKPVKMTSSTFDIQVEGILTDEELYASVGDWQAKQNLSPARTCIGVPQYLVTCSEKDFPACPNEKLPAMVAFETRQVAGLSDEAMTYGFVRQKPTLDRNNPVLIGIGREQLIRERLEVFQANHIRCDDLGIGGVAVTNAFCSLYPTQAAENEPILLLDIGHENTTAIVVAGGQVLFIGSLMCAGERFEKARPQRVHTGEHGLDQVELTKEVGQSPILQAARYLEDEIHGMLETWRGQESAEVAELQVKHVYVSGGVARMSGLAEWLTGRLDTPVEVVGPTVDGRVRPELMQAYGLALQASGKCLLPLSILPADVRSRNIRMRLWPLLAASLALIVLTVFGVEAMHYYRGYQALNASSEIYAALDNCNGLINQIKKKRYNLYTSECRMLPMVLAGNRLGQMMTALDTIAQATDGKNWLVYVGDEESFFRQVQMGQEKEKSQEQNMFGASSSQESRKKDESLVRLNADGLRGVCRLVACGYGLIPETGDPYGELIAFRKRLLQTGVFEDIDNIPESQLLTRLDILQPWKKFVPSNKVKSFVCILVLSDKGYSPEVLKMYLERRTKEKKK